MRFEVAEPGVVRIRDLRRALGKRALHRDEVEVRALVRRGIVRATFALVDKRAGRGIHRQFGCPECMRPSAILRWHDPVGFRCARCEPHRTERQRHRSTRWWRLEGGRQLDQLLRLATKRGAACRLERMAALAEELLAIDRRSLAAALQEAEPFLSS